MLVDCVWKTKDVILPDVMETEPGKAIRPHGVLLKQRFNLATELRVKSWSLSGNVVALPILVVYVSVVLIGGLAYRLPSSR